MRQVKENKYNTEYFNIYSTSKGAYRKAVSALELVRVKPGMKILDVGTGHGILAIECAKQKARVEAIDISSDSIALAKEKLTKIQDQEIQKRINFQQMDARHLDYPDKSFDCIFMLDLMEHLYPDDLEEVFKEIKRVAKDNAQVIIHTSPTSTYMKPVYFVLRKILKRREFRGDEFDVNLQSFISFSRNINFFTGDKQIRFVKRSRFFSRSIAKRDDISDILRKIANILDKIIDSRVTKVISKVSLFERLLATDLWAKVTLTGVRGNALLLVTPFFRPNLGGVETRFDGICEFLSKRGKKVFVLTYQPIITKTRGQARETKENLEIYRIWWFGGDLFHKLLRYPLLEVLYLVPPLLFKTLWFLIFNCRKIDVIHAPGLNSSLIGIIAKKIFKKRLVISTHTIYSYKPGYIFSKILQYIFNQADSIVALSYASKKQLEEYGVSKDKIIVHTTWVNQDNFKPLDKNVCKLQKGWSGNFVILFVGRLLAIKGMELLINVARSLKDENKKILFVFIGDGPEKARLLESSRNLRNVQYLGMIDNYDLVTYYNAADICVIPSLYQEGFGRVGIEALSCGLPIIAAKNSGMAEVMPNDIARFVEPTVKNLKKEIVELFNNREALRQMSQKAVSYSRRNFSSNNMESLLKAYDFKN
jgi:glycosyltransferase involved in cell wall biosynthesis/SAM-dependent methyltransferase